MRSPDEGLLLITTCTKLRESPQRVLSSLLLMNEAIRCESKFLQLLILVFTSYNLVSCSLNVRADEESPLFLLFYQTWFVQLLNSPVPCEYRELIVVALTHAAIYYKNYDRPSCDAWIKVAFEVLDICLKVLDWDTANIADPKFAPRQSAPLSYILFIEEIAAASLAEDSATKRTQLCLTEIAKRFIDTVWEMSTVKNELTKIYAILLISKYWQPNEAQSSSVAQLLVISSLRLESRATKTLQLRNETKNCVCCLL
eukprot:TRINITY_DN5076_c0_g2_i8.p2 TRINITY_DN5076_c0_g2~~TRINITY_DN5076_c0_g2_i8.p2  ORF type:complete len:256 (+),score=46.85 TRINITY_DN5076_c0_g2_i8:1299-2066(+)